MKIETRPQQLILTSDKTSQTLPRSKFISLGFAFSAITFFFFWLITFDDTNSSFVFLSFLFERLSEAAHHKLSPFCLKTKWKFSRAAKKNETWNINIFNGSHADHEECFDSLAPNSCRGLPILFSWFFRLLLSEPLAVVSKHDGKLCLRFYARRGRARRWRCSRLADIYDKPINVNIIYAHKLISKSICDKISSGEVSESLNRRDRQAEFWAKD